ncbi:hypothetical protein [Thermodesulfovibrio yellowstonii]|uniref:hypothetical protein n=1 Tax=Thermodesulfovibrio yellowstonii TaxID=28262 RepID=UPI0024B38333|nr:hypothetical protein [Thermodesulfovibrio yellowstonii]MDI6865765.1 hypothetical protein [Thermodesulfovibrio yellowstonii]
MKLYIARQTKCWINGKEYAVESGLQDVPDAVAEVLLYAGQARKVEEEQRKEDKRKK